MSQQLQILNLPLYTTNHIPGEQFPSGDVLEGDLAAAGLMDSQFDLAKGTFTQDLDDLILIEPLHVPGGGRRLH
jgi:hypothetical protein